MVELAMQREVDGYVLKPYKMETMVERARLLTGRRGKSRGAT
jgi:DNA-binding NarL/FixJ family response regulator